MPRPGRPHTSDPDHGHRTEVHRRSISTSVAVVLSPYATSYRSSIMTLSQAATKSPTNASRASSQA